MGRMAEFRNILAQNMDKWWALLKTVMILPVSEFAIING